MGYGPDEFTQILNLHARNALQSGAAIGELGAQQLYCTDAEKPVGDFIRHFSPEAEISGDDLSALCNMGLAGDVLRMAGFRYESFDVNEALTTVKFDLNTDMVSPAHHQQFDLVTNFGTSEHVLNQFNTFRVMHDLTKVGGLMWHNVPMSGWFDHSLISYNPKFFMVLSGNNFYNIVNMKIFCDDYATPLSEDNAYIDGARGVEARNAFIQVIYQKTQNVVFLPALDHLEGDEDGETFRYMIRNALRLYYAEDDLIRMHPQIKQLLSTLLERNNYRVDAA